MDPTPGPPLPSAEAAAPAEIHPVPPRFQPVASYVHTAALVAILLMVGLLSGWAAQHRPPEQSTTGPLPQYLQTIVFQWVMFILVVLGIRRRGVAIADILGKGWKSVEDMLMDIGLAVATFVATLFLRAVALILFLLMWKGPQVLNDLGAAFDSLQKSSLKSIEHLFPHSGLEITAAMCLALTAGFVEEFLFRGYLQRQCMALTQSAALGILLTTAVFTVGHLYQDKFPLTMVAVLGLTLSILAHFRRNLRPGIMLHMAQDILALLAPLFLTKFLAK